MARCANCGCDLPGMETLCRGCYYLGYAQVHAPKKTFWQWLGVYGWIVLLVAAFLAVLHAEFFLISRSPRLLHGAELLRQGFIWVISWIVAPWILITDWRAERTLRTLFFGLIFVVQLICAVLWWTTGAQVWFQINLTVAIVMLIYSKLAQVFGPLKDL